MIIGIQAPLAQAISPPTKGLGTGLGWIGNGNEMRLGWIGNGNEMRLGWNGD